ncbi:MAG: hypothetical protein ACRD4V_13980 [Candidatus Acidiferrales bacterium]
MPIDLIKEGTVQFSVPSPSVVDVGAKCDADGNMYAVWSDAAPTLQKFGEQLVANGPSTVSEPVRKLVLESKEIIAYRRQPIPDYAYQTRLSFAVSPDGAVSDLVVARHDRATRGHAEAEYFVEKFKDDGDFDSRVKLEVPDGKYLNASKFATFADGRFLVMGMVRDGYLSRDQKPFAGIFDSSGRFLSKLRFTFDEKAKYPGMGAGTGKTQAGEGAMVAIELGSVSSDPAGDVYIKLAGDPVQAIAVSPSGEVEREIKLNTPAKGLSSAETGVAESGLMYVHFYPFRDTRAATPEPPGMIGTIDVMTGQYDQLYRLPPNAEQRTMGVCGDSQGNFLFLESNPQSKLEVTKYSAQ